ncbi:MAG: DUF6364 family protein [Rhodothermales bacterium]
METTEISIRLPKDEVEFLEAYAQQHGMSVADVIDQFIQRLQDTTDVQPGIHPEVQRISGMVPEEVDARAVYRAHLLRKHR